MSNPVIDQIQNPRLRELADQCVHRSRGDFGMVVEGGVDLERFAQRIVDACADVIQKEKDTGLYNSNQMAGMTVARAVVRDVFQPTDRTVNIVNKITTADCKKFLADYFQNNLDALKERFGDDDDPEYIEHLQKIGSKPGEWIREWKAKPQGKDMNWYSTQTGFTTTQGEKTFGEIESVRCFVLDPAWFDTAVRYLVIEGKDGNLYLGDMIGE